MSVWPVVELGDHVDLSVGFPFKSAQFLDNPKDAIRLLRGDNVAQGVLRWDGAKHWPLEQVDTVPSGLHLSEGDIILAMDRPWISAGLKYAYVRQSDLPCLLVQRVARLRGTATLATDYLRHIIGSFAFTAHVQSITTGVNVPHISGRDIKRFRFALPSIREQQRIAEILGAYDDLIEVNRQRVALLEEMARGLFEEWFVRFRFPGHEGGTMQETSAGPLPLSWSWARFGDLVADVRDAVAPTAVDGSTPYVGLEHMPRRSTTLDANGSADEVTSTKLRFRRGDVLFGKIRPYFHKVVWAPFDGVASSDAIVFRPRIASAALALSVASSDPFVAHSVQTSNGTKMPRANTAVLKAYPVAVGPEGLMDRFERVVTPGIEQAAILQASNQKLAAARDLLLPRLISGQLSVAQAELELAQAA